MMRLFLTELKKIRRRHVGLLFIAAFFLTLLWLLWAMGKMDEKDQLAHQGYYYLLVGIPLMNSIFLPTILACVESRLCDIEQKGSTLKLLCTMQPRHSIFHVKLVLSFVYLLLFTLAETALMPALCEYFHFEQPLPADLLGIFFLSTFTVGAVLIILQQSLSLLSDSQLFPLFFGVGGTFVGIFSWFFPKLPLRYLLPWGYYCVFLTVDIDYNEATRVTTYFPIPFPWKFFAGFLIFGILAYLVGKNKFMKKEV